MSSQNTANYIHPLLIMRPTKKSHYANVLSSFFVLFIITIPSILLIKVLEDTFLRINWIQYYNSMSTSTIIEMLTYGVLIIFASFLIIFIISWGLIFLFGCCYALISPFYWIFALKYKKYSFFPTNLVVDSGLFIKTKKVYPYRSITSVGHYQTLVERLVGISSLGIYVPKKIPLIISRVEKEILLELFKEFRNLILITKNRKMVKSESNLIRLREITKPKQKEDISVKTYITIAVSELQSVINGLKIYFHKREMVEKKL
ncbi:MAG: hypothetical protein KAT16_06645 [Candidatus Heimdallarchaeota archaeon]|nr:hypothetical protein [Candidatus Heimdallarchaeota archaeon]